MLNPALKPATPINPAERPIAEAVLRSALLDIHPLENFNRVFLTLKGQYPDLVEELFERLEQEQQERLAEQVVDTCKIIQLIPVHKKSESLLLPSG